MNLLTALFLPLLAAADEAAPLIVPDSVQKANFAEAVRRLANLDIDSLLRSLLSESIWIVVKILIALAIYFVGRWIVHRLIRFLDAICERRQVDISLRSFLRNTVRVQKKRRKRSWKHCVNVRIPKTLPLLVRLPRTSLEKLS